MNAPISSIAVAQAPQLLDPLRFSLSGRSLIEASAGTGKTFTIAMLYVRLVLGHDPANDRVAPLTPPEILVVTFTDAATKELRERIRARLTEAAAAFQAEPDTVEPPGPGREDPLDTLRSEYPPHKWPACARRLQLAAEWMDEAAVSTIHGWCNRMLREHAFDSDSLFTQTLETDQGELLAEVVRDYWRTFLAPLDATNASTVAQWLSGPEALQKTVSRLLEVAPLLREASAPEAALRDAREARARELARIKAPWQAWLGEMKASLDAARAARQYVGTAFGKANCERWFNELSAWAIDPLQTEPSLTPTAWARLTPQELEHYCQHGTPPSHPGFDALTTLREALAALPTAREDVLSHAACWVAERFSSEQARRAQMGFDDLLTRLDAALQGPNGEHLAKRIREQFPVALIDEFQDTDPVQYSIFDVVYRDPVGHPGDDDRKRAPIDACQDTDPVQYSIFDAVYRDPVGRPDDDDRKRALILIGDPKQAIYAFRGADIHTYLAARRSCGTRLYTLAKNYRSTQAMVDATNACFNFAETREEGDGAFLFRGSAGNPVPFFNVSAEGRDDAFTVAGKAPRALTAWWLPPPDDGKPLGKTAYLDHMAASCATEIVRLLNLGRRGQAAFVGHAGQWPLYPADIAVLVNNRGEADAIREALARRDVRTVYLSDKDSVFQSAQAAEMQHWLAACADPEDGRLVRTALATATLGLGFAELDALFGNELAWEACVLQFRGYRECWRRQGVLPMLRRLLNDFRVPVRLLGLQVPGAPGGERTLTDLLHLAELLQQASTMIEGEHGLIRYLVEQRDAANDGNGGNGGGDDARQIRLESDGDLVKVVTIHKSKGLEYPLVFLPFACAYRPADAKDLPFKWHDARGKAQVALTDTGGVLQKVDDERLGEDLRKLYVALTRARYATWIGMAPLKDFERCAIGYLLNGRQPLAHGDLEHRLQQALGASPNIAVLPAPQASGERLARQDENVRHGRARESARVMREPWWVASYSSLKTIGGAHAAQAAPDTPAEDGFIEARNAAAELDAEQAAALAPFAALPARHTAAQPYARALHEFPRGSDQGSFLHDLLEWAVHHGFAQVAADAGPLREVVARRCSVRGWERWIEPLTEWVRQIVSTPLVLKAGHGMEATSFTLSGLRAAIGEMEFWLEAHHVDTASIDSLVREFTLGEAPRPALEPAQLNGMLKGFMDLVFEHEGRYYVADYKSNWLGSDDAAYTPEKIRAQMLRSRYDLQYVLYLLALHRLLKARQPDYDYDEHIGGAVYLFLRGLNAPTQGVFAERPPRELIERLDALFAGNAGGAGSAGNAREAS